MARLGLQRPDRARGHDLALLLIAGAAAAPGPLMRALGSEPESLAGSLVFGLSIVGAAFLISWAAEAAQHDVSQALALAFIAFIAVLPEYAVDVYFAWQAADDPTYRQFAVANMTGANRLLIGAGWPVVVFLYWWRTRRRELVIERGQVVEVTFLGLATLYVFSLPLKGQIDLIDTLVLGSLFGLYLYFAARHPVEEPELFGPAKLIGDLPQGWRRLALAALFLYAGGAIFGSAEPFANGLVATGEEFGIDQFLLVQWLAPLASESPEMLIAILLVLRNQARAAMSMLISAKVNQWTLLIGTLPVAFAINGASLAPLDFDARQSEEVFLTAAQSAFAVVILLSLSISLLEAGLLLGLFGTQLFFTDPTVRWAYGFAYLGLTALFVLRERRTLPTTLRTARQVFGAVLRNSSARGETEKVAPGDGGTGGGGR